MQNMFTGRKNIFEIINTKDSIQEEIVIINDLFNNICVEYAEEYFCKKSH